LTDTLLYCVLFTHINRSTS